MKQDNALPMAEPYILDRILAFLKPYPLNAKILDIATGQGYLLERLNRTGFKTLHGADLNPANFKLDKQKYHFRYIDANQKLSYPTSCFDIVISSETIEHLENPRLFLREIYRILKPEGQFILTTPSVDSIISRLHFLLSGKLAFHTPNDYALSGHISILPATLIERFCQDIGFTLKGKTYSSCYLPILKWRLTHPIFLNSLLGWIVIYNFSKSKT